MTGPAVVSVARIEPDLARRSWNRVRRLVARDDQGGASDDLRCFIAVFGHGGGLPETIERVRRVLGAGTPDHLRPHITVQAALSSESSADTPGTLYDESDSALGIDTQGRNQTPGWSCSRSSPGGIRLDAESRHHRPRRSSDATPRLPTS